MSAGGGVFRRLDMLLELRRFKVKLFILMKTVDYSVVLYGQSTGHAR